MLRILKDVIHLLYVLVFCLQVVFCDCFYMIFVSGNDPKISVLWHLYFMFGYLKDISVLWIFNLCACDCSTCWYATCCVVGSISVGSCSLIYWTVAYIDIKVFRFMVCGGITYGRKLHDFGLRYWLRGKGGHFVEREFKNVMAGIRCLTFFFLPVFYLYACLSVLVDDCFYPLTSA